MKEKLKVVELFAGVGGFRIGLEGWKGYSSTTNFKGKISEGYDIVWSNQWEPSTKRQHASEVYEARFGKKNHSNEDIENVPTSEIPDHDLLVGGFPCQDYSVATTLKNSKGLIGKKGVLWWSIHRILTEKKIKPKYLILENVDRLLKSPASQRGRDFAVMLKSLAELGYAIEWRVINAAEYGFPQRRRRVFFVGYHKSTHTFEEIENSTPKEWLLSDGLFAKSFKAKERDKYSEAELELNDSLVEISDRFNEGGSRSPFENSGLMINGKVVSVKLEPEYSDKFIVLKDVLQVKDINESFYINDSALETWEYQKGAKTIERTSSNGHVYKYSEGGMSFPDSVEKPSRTIITGEGGKTASRFKHVIRDPYSKKLRRLTPLELERLNMFPDNHTKLTSITDGKRAFFMGNALVVGVVERIGESLIELIKGN